MIWLLVFRVFFASVTDFKQQYFLQADKERNENNKEALETFVSLKKLINNVNDLKCLREDPEITLQPQCSFWATENVPDEPDRVHFCRARSERMQNRKIIDKIYHIAKLKKESALESPKVGFAERSNELRNLIFTSDIEEIKPFRNDESFCQLQEMEDALKHRDENRGLLIANRLLTIRLQLHFGASSLSKLPAFQRYSVAACVSGITVHFAQIASAELAALAAILPPLSTMHPAIRLVMVGAIFGMLNHCLANCVNQRVTFCSERVRNCFQRKRIEQDY